MTNKKALKKKTYEFVLTVPPQKLRIPSRVFSAVVRAQRPLTTRQIAKYAEVSWPTAKQYLLELYETGAVAQKKFKNRTYWKPTPEAFKDFNTPETLKE